MNLGKAIQNLRRARGISQGDLAAQLDVTVQSVSKWETGKANPDVFLIPRLAEYFHVRIDDLFYDEADFSEQESAWLEGNRAGWERVYATDWQGTTLPSYGAFTPAEDELHLMGDIRGKAVLEIACAGGESLKWMGENGARELWGIDTSESRIASARRLLREADKPVKLFVSPVEVDPGLPHRHFDIIYSLYGLGWSLDLDKTFARVCDYIKPGGRLVFSLDHPLMQCLEEQDGRFVLSGSYVDEREIEIVKRGAKLRLRNWKLSSYINRMADHSIVVERLVEESVFDDRKDRDGKYYRADRARLINQTIIVQARKL